MMRSVPCCNNICGLNLRHHHASQARVAFNPLKHGFSFSAKRVMQLQSLVISARVHSKLHQAMNDNLVQGAPPPPTPNSPSWAKWLLQLMMSLVMPFWKLSGGQLLKIGYKAETVLDIAEEVAEVVEDVAEAVEKAASQVSDNLPGAGMLKDAAEWVEDASEDLAEGARLATNIIRKVDEIKDGLEDEVENLFDMPHTDRIDLVGEETKLKEK
eukprot:TRINITY_DN22646_c0_g2_i2.p1 TRINITY_DN22646_c0_g2~~TRINITY_DN22646_c0_g2_i2.p1  ORF type:complete len:213 (+),score=38.86 TRINITY_DN22646_c0_g2_i2:107-745(+)